MDLSMDTVKSPLLYTSTDETSDSESTFAENTKLDIDQALEVLGSWGKFNILLLLAMMFCNLTVVYQLTFSYFIGNDPSWRCAATNVQLNSSRNDSFCSRNQGRDIHIDDGSFYERCTLPRENWTYVTDKMYSYTTEFDLVCDRRMLGAVISASFFCGMIFQMMIGPIVDIYGRKVTAVVILCIGICFSIGCSYVTEVWQLMSLRLVVGATLILSSSIFFCLLAEFTTPTSRSLIVCIYMTVSCSISQLVIDALAYYVRDWRKLNTYATLPIVLALVVILFVPRSPRWLLEKGKIFEAERVLQNAAYQNGHYEFMFSLKPPSTINEIRTYTYLDLVRTWKPFRMTSCLALVYMAIGMLSYEVSLEADHLGADIYISYALSTLADIPGYFVAFYLCNCLGRKKTVLTSLFISGVIMGSIALVPVNYSARHTVRVTLAMLSKVSVSASNFGFFVWVFELFPTVLRAQGGTICLILHQIGVISVPLLTTALHPYNPILIYIILGLSAIIVSVIGCALKETNKLPTRETYEDLLMNE